MFEFGGKNITVNELIGWGLNSGQFNSRKSFIYQPKNIGVKNIK